jgi:hypothetical protein
MNMNLMELETELKKLAVMPPWGRKQQDDWDSCSNFIYQLPSYEELIQKLTLLDKGIDFNHYVIHRWFNTLSALGIEKMFAQCKGVIPNSNKYDKWVDFSIGPISFDHKTSVFPKHYGHSLAYAEKNPEHLIQWLYQEQSKQQRFHLRNRLFILLFKENGAHWKLRAELNKIKDHIEYYVTNFDHSKLQQIKFENGTSAWSDIIWIKD